MGGEHGAQQGAAGVHEAGGGLQVRADWQERLRLRHLQLRRGGEEGHLLDERLGLPGQHHRGRRLDEEGVEGLSESRANTGVLTRWPRWRSLNNLFYGFAAAAPEVLRGYVWLSISRSVVVIPGPLHRHVEVLIGRLRLMRGDCRANRSLSLRGLPFIDVSIVKK